MKAGFFNTIALGVIILSPGNTQAATSAQSPTPNSYSIGSITQSNQEDFERFEGAFYFGWAPMNLSHTNLASDNGYSTEFDSKRTNGLNLGVRHSISSFRHFAILGDYSVMIDWLKGTFSSTQFQVTNSSSTTNLFSLGLSPKMMGAYYLTDTVHPFVGMATAFLYSRLQSPLSGGDNEFFEFHYGPMIGVQVVNLPIQQMFFSTEWIQYVKQSENSQRLYSDNGRFQIDLGLNF